jgi:Ni,Fe-hydrogenase I cytochrome b subunit
MKQENSKDKKYLFDKPGNMKILAWSFFLSLVLLLVLEFFVHKHTHFPSEEWPEFYCVFGFVAFVALVLSAKYILRTLVKRREDYYD